MRYGMIVVLACGGSVSRAPDNPREGEGEGSANEGEGEFSEPRVCSAGGLTEWTHCQQVGARCLSGKTTKDGVDVSLGLVDCCGSERADGLTNRPVEGCECACEMDGRDVVGGWADIDPDDCNRGDCRDVMIPDGAGGERPGCWSHNAPGCETFGGCQPDDYGPNGRTVHPMPCCQVSECQCQVVARGGLAFQCD